MKGRCPIFKVATLSAMLLLFGACQSLPEQNGGEDTDPVAESTDGVQTPESGTPPQDRDSLTVPDQDNYTTPTLRQEIREIGDSQFINPEAAEKPVRSNDEGDITLNFQQTDLREFIKAILGGVLNENYIIDEQVGGTVTLETARPLDREELFPLFEEVLGMNNAAVVRKNNVYEILPRNRAAAGTVSPSTIRHSSRDGYSIRIIPLQHIAAQEMQKILEPFIPENGDLRIDKKRNLIIISGTSREIATVQQTVDIFDVDWLRGMSVGLYPLDYVEPETLQKELNSIINAVEGGDGKEMLGGMVRTVPIERLNSILLIGSTPAALREVEIWLHRLDKPGNHPGKRLYVYNVQNAKATELADILGHIFQSTVPGGTGNERQPGELAPGTRPAEISGGTGESGEESRPDPSRRDPASSTASSVNLSPGKAVEIIADDVRNSIVVLATPQEYKMVEATIKKLDVVPLQVLIEASIIEVTLNENLNYGVEWFFKNSIDRGNARGGEARLDLGSSGISPVTPGFSYIINTADDVRFALNALAEESELNVLSSPSLMVLDNQTASINVGDEIPVPTRQAVSLVDSNAPSVNEIQFRQTGVTLTVTPRVNTGGLVTMEVKQEVSNAVSTTTSELNAPTIQQRQIESVVAINSGETIVLGGLIQDTHSNSDSGIPGLYRIPLIGRLFGQTQDEKRRTELLVLITPRVVGNRDEARDITEEFRKKLKGIRPVTDDSEVNDPS